mmetsp:Transcript_26312/g.86356  ORF Transcript_26312/g.86356 Transcript_26312/m.86356 type:complete len:213 (-) Transcript_26312:942-1580(-)
MRIAPQLGINLPFHLRNRGGCRRGGRGSILRAHVAGGECPGARLHSGGLLLPRAHLSRIEHTVRVRLALKPKLRPIRLLHPAILEDVRVRVKDIYFVRFEKGDDFVKPFLGGVFDHGKIRKADAAAETYNFQVVHNLLGRKRPREELEQFHGFVRRPRRLQIRKFLVLLQREQRCVIPAVFVERHRSRAVLSCETEGPSVSSCETLKRPERG